MDEKFLHERIKHITDEDLFSSLKLDLPGLKGVRAAVRAKDYSLACEAWREYLLKVPEKRSRPDEIYRRGDLDWNNIVREADRVVARDIKCWSDVYIRYDGEIDFSRDAGKPYIYGFHYFGWIVPLSVAYRQTRDEKYARAFLEIFMQWYRQRDLVKGSIPRFDGLWYELGVGNRPPIFTDLYFATLASEAARRPEYHLNMLKTMLGHARWLYRHETSYRAGNWQICGTKALLFTGLAYPEFRESHAWVRRGMKWLVAHARRDVYADGGHKERAPHYHLGVADDFLSVYRTTPPTRALARQRREIGAVASRMMDWPMRILTPSCHIPTVGDSEYDPQQERFLRAGLLFGNPELVWTSRASSRDIDKARKSLHLKETVSPRAPSVGAFHGASSGFIIIRNGWKKEDLYFGLNYGPHRGGHSHNEALAFQLWANGHPLAVDCGRGISYDDPLHRTWYVTPHAHNMVVVDGAAPSIKGRKGKLLFWERSKDLDFIGLTHNGYLEQGVRHRRCLLIRRSQPYIVVLDFLTAQSGDHRYEWTLNSPLRDFRVSRGRAVSPDFWVGASDPDRIEAVQRAKVRMCLPIEGQSTWGMERGEGTNLRFVRRGGTLAFHVLLLPTQRPSEVRFTVTQADPRSRLRIEVETTRFKHHYMVNCLKGDFQHV
ncbi:MAG: alginate lyase family protein [Candidatus Latescibacteria bacterium]|nr:alginate lyase family protein [Candidatus Latescibacterota bacterium]